MGSECSTLAKAMRHVDVLACQIARAKGFAAAMIDAAMRRRFELMVAEFHRKLDAIEEHPVCQRENDKKGRRATAWPCDRARLRLTFHPSRRGARPRGAAFASEIRSAAIDKEPWCLSPIKVCLPECVGGKTYKVRTYGRNHSFRGIAF
jgi:hypothetical protein